MNHKIICLNCKVVFIGQKRRKYCTIRCKGLHNGFSKGSTPWNKDVSGYHLPEETKQKMSKASLGKPKSISHRLNISKSKAGVPRPSIRGINNYRWKGGSDRSERIRFRVEVQKRILARDNFTCQICDQYGGYLQVDHIKKWSDYPELRFDMNNCRTLCMACHYYVTFKRKLPQGVIWGHNLSRRIAS